MPLLRLTSLWCVLAVISPYSTLTIETLKGLRGDSQSGKSTKEVSNEVALLTQRRLQPKTEKHRDKIEEKGTTSRRNMSYGNPLVWRHIAIAQSRVGWNPNRIADYIKKYDTEGFFGRVKGSLVRRWIDPVTKNQWTPEALKRVEKWGQAGSVGRSKIMVSPRYGFYRIFGTEAVYFTH